MKDMENGNKWNSQAVRPRARPCLIAAGGTMASPTSLILRARLCDHFPTISWALTILAKKCPLLSNLKGPI